jgi:hypothetical protein
MMPGTRYARMLMIIVAIVVALGMVVAMAGGAAVSPVAR